MKKIMEKVMSQITDNKAQGDLMFSNSSTLKMSSQKNEIATYNVTSSQILGVRIIKNGKVGLSYTEALDDDSLNLAVKQALQNAEVTDHNPHEQIMEISGEINDELIVPEDEVDISVKTRKALELESKIRSLDSRVSSVPYNGYSEQDYYSYYLSSKGRFTTYKDKSYSITTSAVMEDQGIKSSFYDYHTSHTFKDLKFDKVIETSLFHARNLLQEKSLPTGKYSIRFSEDSLQSIINCFSNFYSAKASMDQMNPWASKLGENVISKDLTIIDHPLFERSFRTSKFDSEGVERKPLTLIDNGELKSFYHNSVTANFFKTKTTGHAARGPSAPMGVYGTDLLIQGKNVKPLPEKYLEVIQLAGLHSGANRVTGTFSLAVKGYLWERGERVATIGNVTISGNLMDFLNNVEVVGTELLASTDESFFSVPLIFHGVSVAGQ